MIGETKEYGSKGFKKRDFVIITAGEYPQHVQLEFVQDKCELLDKFNVGQDVSVEFNVRGREWQSPEGDLKHFVSLDAWKITDKTGAQADVPFTPDPELDASDIDEEQPDDLPF